MVLSQIDIKKAVASGKIKFDPPLEERQYGEASIDLRLGNSFTCLRAVSGVKISLIGGIPPLPNLWDTVEIGPPNSFGSQSTFCLEPDQFVLALTHETITVPKNMIALVEGRSTYARMGLSMHQTAPWIQPGWCGKIVLEIKNHGPLKIELTPILDRPCQLTFFQLKTPLPAKLAYGAKAADSYAHQQHPLQHKKPRGKTAK